MVAEVFSVARGCNADELVHAEGYQAQNCFPIISLEEVEAEKMRRTFARKKETPDPLDFF